MLFPNTKYSLERKKVLPVGSVQSASLYVFPKKLTMVEEIVDGTESFRTRAEQIECGDVGLECRWFDWRAQYAIILQNTEYRGNQITVYNKNFTIASVRYTIDRGNKGHISADTNCLLDASTSMHPNTPSAVDVEASAS